MCTRRLLTCRKASQELQGAAEVLIVRKPPPGLQAEGSRPSASQRRCGNEGVSKTFLATLLEKRSAPALGDGQGRDHSYDLTREG